MSVWTVLVGHTRVGRVRNPALERIFDIPTWQSPGNSFFDTKRNGQIEPKQNSIRQGDEAPCTEIQGFEDIKRCYPDKMKIPNKGECGDPSIESWLDVQRCLNGPTIKNTRPLSGNVTVHLIGERHSGTKFAIHQLQTCFPKNKYGVIIRRDMSRSKHFFQPVPMQTNETENRILIALFREPTDWVAAMIRKPFHMPHHIQGLDKNFTPIPLDWEEFVSRPWTLPDRTKRDLEIIAQNRTRQVSCQKNFSFQEVVPCLPVANASIPQHIYRGLFPLYELRRDGSGQPYDNILQLRSDKIVNFLLEQSLLQRLRGYLAVRYEDMVLNGTRDMLEQVANMLGLPGLPSDCSPQTPSPERLIRKDTPSGLRQWVEDNINVNTERLLGYR
jgi:hypothetical protein